MVEYRTPANTEGLGTRSRLRKNSDPIRGVMILIGDVPDLLHLSMRLPADYAQFASTIVRQTEHEASTPANREASVPACEANPGFDFQIVTDKQVYAPKAMMHVKFLVANTDYTERQDKATELYGFPVLYVDRTLSYCSDPMGFFWLTVLDKNDKSVPIQRCSADAIMAKVNAVELLANPKTGIALSPGEVYGREGEFQLPAKKGKYSLSAELFTGWFPEKQLQALAEKHIRTPQALNCKMHAPVVTVTVK